MPAPNSKYKDRLFSFIFGSEEHKDWTLALYNAVNGTSYVDSSLITITTIREVLYLGMRNDVSLLLMDYMEFWEQQSTPNENMPYRFFEYAPSVYERYIRAHKLNKYGQKRMSLPVPKFVVFYNGKKSLPAESTLRLSDSFPADKRKESDIDVRVRVINVNKGQNPHIMKVCKPLEEYSWIVEEIRQREKLIGLEAAIDKAVDSMPDDFILKPFLEEHKAEVKGMLLTEYNEVEQMELFKEEGRAEGQESAKREAALNLRTKLSLSAKQIADILGLPTELIEHWFVEASVH